TKGKSMIYTVTLNPALDRSIEVQQLRNDDANRIESEKSYAGGKGIDASRVIQVLGGQSIALGFVGGFNGMELEQRLLRQGVRCDFVETRGDTRTNIIIYVRSTGTYTTLNAKGPDVNEVETKEILDKISGLTDVSYMIISGSIPSGVSQDIYRQIVEIARAKGAFVALDADGEPMKQGIEAGPTIIKPNVHELGRLMGREITDIPGALDSAEGLKKKRVDIVLVSMGAKGALLVSDSARLFAVPPKIAVGSTVGAGDSLLAGFVLGHFQGRRLAECLRFGVAAGAATAMSRGTELCKREDVEELMPKVEIREV
ncbi:MAG: 1-phosphofructokinase, partial [Candidatus Dadabacteria bacterium]|nr:1-phosphofructokinase [Candidatus Dadabacteria bacterium]